MIYLRMMLWLFVCGSSQVWAELDNIQRAVWVNEAIIATYTYDSQNFMSRQKDIAKYYTANGWMNYSKALHSSNIPEMVKKNSYSVSAVATMPPEVNNINGDANQWQAIMPILVIYKNATYKQKQLLKIKMTFVTAPSGTGVRGFAITNLQATVTEPACQCSRQQAIKAVA